MCYCPLLLPHMIVDLREKQKPEIILSQQASSMRAHRTGVAYRHSKLPAELWYCNCRWQCHQMHGIRRSIHMYRAIDSTRRTVYWGIGRLCKTGTLQTRTHTECGWCVIDASGFCERTTYIDLFAFPFDLSAYPVCDSTHLSVLVVIHLRIVSQCTARPPHGIRTAFLDISFFFFLIICYYSFGIETNISILDKFTGTKSHSMLRLQSPKLK